jgi:hypothetical protein
VILEPGSHEVLKRAVHRTMQIGAGVCFAYNFAAWCVRRESHLGLSAVVYALLFQLETEHVKHHSAADV